MVGSLISGMAVPTTIVFLVFGSLLTALIGMIGIGGATTGYLLVKGYWYERLLLFVGGVSLIHPEFYTDLFGVTSLLLVYSMQKQRAKSL